MYTELKVTEDNIDDNRGQRRGVYRSAKQRCQMSGNHDQSDSSIHSVKPAGTLLRFAKSHFTINVISCVPSQQTDWLQQTQATCSTQTEHS